MSAGELRRGLLAEEVSVAEVVEAFLAELGDDPHRAWSAVHPRGLRRQAAALDAYLPEARARLPLFGIPVGVKDNTDTAELPTEYGSPIYAGHRPAADAALVVSLRRAGALVAGKTKCAEFAWLTPTDTRNPVADGRTPGGSSSGSAAAVAAGSIPLATGTQTAGSINRPASYCGVLGWKPTRGRYPTGGVKATSPTLDTVGLLARSVDDLLVADAVLAGGSSSEPVSDFPGTPRIAFARTELWERVEPAAAAAIEAWVADCGLAVASDLALPGYARLAALQERTQLYELSRCLAPELRDAPDGLSPPLRAALVEGAAISAAAMEPVYAEADALAPALLEALRPFDAVLTPSTLGVPPLGLASTGDSLFCRVWTLTGAPSLSVPLAWTPDGLPAGLQLVGLPGRDRRVLAAAARLVRASRATG